MAARMYMQPGTIARSLLSNADHVDSEAATITAILDAMPWSMGTHAGGACRRQGRPGRATRRPWMLLLCAYDQATNTVTIVAIHDARSASSATTGA